MAGASSKTAPPMHSPVSSLKSSPLSSFAAAVIAALLALTILLPVVRTSVTATASLVVEVAREHQASLLAADVWTLTCVGLAGFAAQLVDGSLGMGYGLTSSSVLVAAGLKPATASASVHLAQVGTTLASGLAHRRAGNVDEASLKKVAPPGALGALAGAALLSYTPAATARLLSATLLFGLGAVVALRFYRIAPRRAEAAGAPSATVLRLIGLLGGFVDSTGGGGWGPIATSGLLAGSSLPPCRVVGTTSASEFFVTVAAVAGFCATHAGGGGGHGARLDLLAVLLLGGVSAAPLAPRLVTCARPRMLGVLIGGFIMLTNSKTLLHAAGAGESVRSCCQAALLVAWLAALASVRRHADDEEAPAGKAGPQD